MVVKVQAHKDIHAFSERRRRLVRMRPHTCNIAQPCEALTIIVHNGFWNVLDDEVSVCTVEECLLCITTRQRTNNDVGLSTESAFWATWKFSSSTHREAWQTIGSRRSSSRNTTAARRQKRVVSRDSLTAVAGFFSCLARLDESMQSGKLG